MCSLPSDQGDVGDQQADQAFALADRGGGVFPERGEVGGERADPGLLFVGERPLPAWVARSYSSWASASSRSLVFQSASSCVGDEPVGRVHGEVAAAGGVGGVLGALHARLADPVGVGRRAAGELG